MSDQAPETPAQKPTPCAFIDDGYTLDFDIPEVPGVSQSLSGTYRPCTSKQRAMLGATWRKANDDQAKIDNATCELLRGQLVTWDLKDRNGTPVPILAGNIGRLYPVTLLGNLMEIILGTDADNTSEVLIIAVVRNDALDNDAKLEEISKLLEARKASVSEAALKN